MFGRGGLSVSLVLIAMTAAAEPLVSTPQIGAVIDSTKTVTLGWTSEPNAAKYMVELSESQDFGTLIALKDAEVVATAGETGASYDVAFASEDESLKPGRTYFWRANAILQNGTRVSGQTGAFRTARSPFASLAENGFSLTRAEEGVDKDKPATLSFIRKGNDEGEEQYIAEFLLAWQGEDHFFPNSRSPFAWSPSVRGAGKLTNDSTDIDTLAKVAAGVVTDWSFRDGAVTLHQNLSAVYEGDQEFDERNRLVEYLTTISAGSIGTYVPRFGNAIQTRWRPYLGLAYGDKVDVADDSTVTEEDVYRIVPQLDVTVRLNAIRDLLGITDVLLSANHKIYFRPYEDRDRLNYFTAALDFEIGTGFTTGLLFKNGYDAPKFKGVNTLALTFGVTFGSSE